MAPLSWVVGYLNSTNDGKVTHKNNNKLPEIGLHKTAVQAVSDYILSDGELELSPERCPTHRTVIINCFECNISMQLHAKKQADNKRIQQQHNANQYN